MTLITIFQDYTVTVYILNQKNIILLPVIFTKNLILNLYKFLKINGYSILKLI